MKPPRLSESIVGLLQIVAQGASPGDQIVCTRRAGRALGASSITLPACSVSSTWIPGPLLRMLEEDFSPWGVSLAARRRKGLGISALAVWFQFTKVLRNPTKPDSPYGQVMCWPNEIIAEAIDRAAAFLPPTLVIDGRSEVVVLWSLQEPLAVTFQDVAARRLFERLAAHVGGRKLPSDARLDDLWVPLPGFKARNAGADPETTVCLALDLERRYTLDQIETALAVAPESAPSPEHVSRRVARTKR